MKKQILMLTLLTGLVGSSVQAGELNFSDDWTSGLSFETVKNSPIAVSLGAAVGAGMVALIAPSVLDTIKVKLFGGYEETEKNNGTYTYKQGFFSGSIENIKSFTKTAAVLVATGAAGIFSYKKLTK